MFKRGVPFTPEPSKLSGRKKQKDYHSPSANKTPLRNLAANVMANSPLAGNSVARPSPGTPLNDDERERREDRARLAKDRNQSRRELLSPALTTKVRAQPASMILTPRSRQHQLEKLLPHSPLIPSTTSAMKGPAATTTILTMEQRNRIFEEWMKIAADNKINSKNSWNVALIDYFSELTFLKDGDSINFQKASCTLDGCVKIYSTRVDSVADETTKLLNGLADGAKKGNSNWDEPPTATEQDGEGVEEGGERFQKIHPKRPHKSVDTLEKSFDALNLKQMEVAFAVDPLFKKTCAEFDESGSKGFLTSNLVLTSSGALLFDSSNAPILDQGGEFKETQDTIDISILLETCGRALFEAEDMVICPSLNNLSLGAIGTSDPITKQLEETLSRLNSLPAQKQMDLDVDTMAEQSCDDDSDKEVLIGDAVPLGGMFGLGEDEIVPMDDDMGYFDDIPPPEPLACDPTTIHLPGVVTKSSSAAVSATAINKYVGKYEDEEEISAAGSIGHNLLSYFDSSDNRIQRNWAGPEHWKIRRPHLARTGITQSEAPKSARPNLKKDFCLDFDVEAIDLSTLFIKANPASITLSKGTIDGRIDNDNLLPEDLHFNSSELVRLFTRPNWSFGKRKVSYQRPVILETQHQQEQPGELPADFWTREPTAIREGDLDLVPMDDGPMDVPSDAEDVYYDEPPLPDLPSNTIELSPGMDLGKSLVSTFKASTSVSLNYARKAKRVDVKELKRVLWEEFSIISNLNASKSAKVQEISLSTLIRSLPQSDILQETLNDVSVSYCFICLLHLANEHNLDLQSNSNKDIVIYSNT